MLEQGSGVIIFLTAIPARAPIPGASGIGAAYGAVETLMRTMAIELGPAGVRVVCLRTTANPDTRTIQDATEVRAQMMGVTPASHGPARRGHDAEGLAADSGHRESGRVPRIGPGAHDDRHRPQRISRSGHGLRTRADRRWADHQQVVVACVATT